MIKSLVSSKSKTVELETPAKTPTLEKIGFADLGINKELVAAVEAEGYTHPTPIQAQAIPHILEGRDLLGCAQTGTGKTAAFALPTLQIVMERADISAQRSPIKVLVLTPTRELAIQIDESFRVYGKHTGVRHAVVFGGVGQNPQERALRQGPHVLVATPGRLLDLMNQNIVKLDQLKIFILDEADRMLDMGFIHDVRRVIKALPKERQTLFFSATMPDDIQKLADSILTDPVGVSVTPVSSTAETVQQQIYFVDQGNKRHLLLHLMQDQNLSRALVFARTKHSANKVAEHLSKNNIRAEAIHGNKSQTARQRALENFKRGTTRVLVASDLASRGIDIDEISHVINYDIPNVPETYVHRIGRTGRAGAEGIAISFCDINEVDFLKGIERITKQRIPVVDEHPYPALIKVATEPADGRRRGAGGGGGRKPQSRGRSGGGHGGGGRGGDHGGGRSRR